MNLDRLLRPDCPWLQLMVMNASEGFDRAWALQREGTGRLVSRVLRGQKMRTSAGLFDEVGAALQFPPYFGENWDALEECLTDLEWLPGDAYLLTILDAVHLLDQDSAESRQTFWEMLEQLAQEWGHPDEGGQPGKAFRILVQCTHEEEAHLRKRLPLGSR